MILDRPWFLLFLALVPLIWWLLRPPGHGRPWSTYRLDLWLRAARELGLLQPRTTTLRSLPAILAALALVLAMAGPRWGEEPGAELLLVLLDRSPSMGARDGQGRTRLDRALEALEAELASVPSAVEVRVVLAGGDRLELVSGQAGSFAEWRGRLESHGVAAWERAGLAELLPGMEAAAGELPVWVLTDRAGPEREVASSREATRILVVGEPVANGALVDLVVAPTWPAPEVLATVLVQPGGGERGLEVRALSTDELLARVLVASSRQAADFLEVPLSWPRAAGAVELHLVPPDAFPHDDVLRFTPLDPPSLRVAVLPGEEPSALARAAAHALATGEGRVVGAGDEPDLIVMEGGRLSSWPKRGRPDWLLLGTAVEGWTGEGFLEAPEVGAWESGHPLLDGLDLSQLGVDRALRVAGEQPPWRMLVQTTAQEPLLTLTESDPRIVHMLFLPSRSSLGAELLWPRFLHRALRWYSRLGEERVEARRPGGGGLDLEESDLEPGQQPPQVPFGRFRRPGDDLSAWFLVSGLVLLALWLLWCAPRPAHPCLPFSSERG